MAIDTLAYVKSLEAAGVDRRAAEAHAQALNEVVTDHVLPDLATKDDIKAEFAALRAELNARFAEIDARFAGIEGRMANLPTYVHLVFMQGTLIVTLFVAAYGLLKLTGHG